jgi:S1-C subfamily serine protease
MTRLALTLSLVSIVLLAATIYQVASIQSDLANLKAKIPSAITPATTVTVTTTVTKPVPVVMGGVSASYSELYDAVKMSVVMIRVSSPVGSAVGSGFVYDETGHIVTNNHVVQGATSIRVVFLDGGIYEARLIGADVDSDIAVLKIDHGERKLIPIRLGDSHSLRIGDVVAAVGNPFGLEGTLTIGVVSQKDRVLPTSRGFSIPGVIQTDAAINPGNSGGPLINMQGEVVGITTAIEPAGVGIGYAVPSSIIKRVVPALIEKGFYQRSWLGVTGLSMDEEISKALGVEVRRGVMIAEVVRGSPADQAGLRGATRTTTLDGRRIPVGGDIITAINGSAIGSIDEFLLYMEEYTSPGQQVVITLYRDGGYVNVTATLGVRP